MIPNCADCKWLSELDYCRKPESNFYDRRQRTSWQSRTSPYHCGADGKFFEARVTHAAIKLFS